MYCIVPLLWIGNVYRFRSLFCKVVSTKVVVWGVNIVSLLAPTLIEVDWLLMMGTLHSVLFRYAVLTGSQYIPYLSVRYKWLLVLKALASEPVKSLPKNIWCAMLSLTIALILKDLSTRFVPWKCMMRLTDPITSCSPVQLTMTVLIAGLMISMLFVSLSLWYNWSLIIVLAQPLLCKALIGVWLCGAVSGLMFSSIKANLGTALTSVM